MSDEINPVPGTIAGIFGGMGPEAMIYLLEKITHLTKAEKDQDHIPVLVYSLPQVPDRTESILSGDKKIISYLIEGVRRLEQAGASFIAIPCNTAHYYFSEMQDAVSIEIIHMIKETVSRMQKNLPDCKQAGLLATSGTVLTGLYQREFEQAGISLTVPGKDVQKLCVMEAVYGIHGIKAAGPNPANTALLTSAAEDLISAGAGCIILGCTEIPLAFNRSAVNVPVFSSTEILAAVIINKFFNINN